MAKWNEVLTALRARIGRGRLSNRDWLDSAAVGGASLADVMEGRVVDADLDPQLVEAFHLQYPNLDTFTGSVREHAGDPDAIRGLLSGVKGKLFEVQYVEHLNEGNLPPGYQAELAGSPTQPGYDVLVKGPDGKVAEALQLKATDDIGYAKEALERYPEYDVVLPRDVAEGIDPTDPLAARFLEGSVDHDQLEKAVEGATEIVGAAAETTPDLVPELALFFIAGWAAIELLRGASKKEVFEETKRRLVKTAAAGAVGGTFTWLASPWVGIPAAIGTRLLLGKVWQGRRAEPTEEEESAKARVFEQLFRLGGQNGRLLPSRPVTTRSHPERV